MQTVSRVFRLFLEWVDAHLPATEAQPDTYEPHEHMDLEPPPYYTPLLRITGR